MGKEDLNNYQCLGWVGHFIECNTYWGFITKTGIALMWTLGWSDTELYHVMLFCLIMLLNYSYYTLPL